MNESGYDNDDRVVLHDDDTATIPDAPGGRDGDWLVERAQDGGYTLRNEGGEQGYVTDEGDRYNRRPKVFDSRDEAIAYVIGTPQDTNTSQDADGDELGGPGAVAEYLQADDTSDTSEANTLDVEARVRDAYRQLATGPEPERAAGRLDRLGPIVPLADLRAALPDVPRETFDTALARLADHSDVHVIPSGRIAHKNMADADRDAALWLGGQHNHTIHIDDARSTDGIVERLQMRDRDQATSMVAALDDAEVESVARAMGVDVFSGEPEVIRQRLIDTSVANHDAWLADARQGREDGTLLYRADTEPEWVAGWTDEDRQRACEAAERLLERADRDESWAYVRDRAARWADHGVDTDAGTGSDSALEDAREAYAQNELDHDRLPTEEGFWASSFAPTNGVDKAPTYTTFGSCAEPGCHWVGAAHIDTETGQAAAQADEAAHRSRHPEDGNDDGDEA